MKGEDDVVRGLSDPGRPATATTGGATLATYVAKKGRVPTRLDRPMRQFKCWVRV